MEQGLKGIFALFGGLALFLYGMDALSRSLETAAGQRMKRLLMVLAGSPVRGVLAGAAVTAVLQSSSAVTVMVLGFVSAGLLTLQQAVPMIFGCNIGTTVTAQLLAFRLEDARYLLLVAGLLLWFAGRGRLHAAGQALFAFGLLFEGIAVMAEAMEPLAAGPVFRQWMAQVRHRPGLGLLAGLGMTLAVNVQQGVQFHQTGGLDPQIVLKGERLSYFLLGCGLLLVKVLQLVFDRFQTLGHLRQCIVDTG